MTFAFRVFPTVFSTASPFIENDHDPRLPPGHLDLPDDFDIDDGDGDETESRRDRSPPTFFRVEGPNFSFTSTQRTFGTRRGGPGRTESSESSGNEDPNDLMMIQLFTNMLRNIVGDHGMPPGARGSPGGTPRNEQQNPRGEDGEGHPSGAGSGGAHPHPPPIPSIFGGPPTVFSGGTWHYDTNARLGPRDANSPQPAGGDVLDLQTGDTNGIFARVLGMPGGGGDYVYSQVELDRVISGLMEQHQGNAPPPASREVIESLPKIKVDQAMVKDGADCAVCKEDLVVDEEVANLPCKHKYHFECVKKWLEAHDTCPICRHPVTPENQRPQPQSPRPHIITTPWSFPPTPSQSQPSGPPPAPDNGSGHASGSRGSSGGWTNIFRRSGGSGQ
ncbi:hypothetical protein P167DRAFT_250810 [Morchella conica CCBAS932]|uniref:RING-type E3 ubiquitin transferase n=1 Tax=Morchella conica CCBAS932 TaxID=1392247 RepID=A0A3N4KJD1_9PEZI|nr:hypothetical protein P167DRAFT_250810 [Morchella conica CCBAS932]